MDDYVSREDVLEKLTNVFKLQAETAEAIVATIPPADVIVRVDDKMYDEFAEELRHTAMNRPFKGRKHDVEHMLKAANALERKHGKWINPRPDSEMCSACGVRFSISSLFAVGGNEEPNYCPNCGADMRGGKANV